MSREASRRPFVAAALAATVLILSAYSNSFHNGFHFDEAYLIVNNLFIRDLANIPRFFTDARTFSTYLPNANYRPLNAVTYAFDYWRAGGLNPVQFHVTQIVLLLATGTLLWLLYRHIFRDTGETRPAEGAALFAAALFCIHTGNTQTVNYISARSELLSGLGVLGGFIVYIQKPEWRRYYVYLIPPAVGALAKTPAVMFAPLFLAYLLLIEQQLALAEIFSRRGWPQVRSVLFRSVPAFLMAVVMYKFVEGMNPPGQTYGGGSRMDYLATETWVWVRYVRLFFFPSGLSADTDLKPFTSWLDARVFAGLVLLAVSVVCMWRASRSRELRPVAFGIAWFWIALVPSSTIFPIGETTNDHRVFFPFMGFTAAIVWWAVVLFQRAARKNASFRRAIGTFALPACALILGIHAIATYNRNRVWLNEETLWADVTIKSPRNGRGLMNYGLTQMRQGRYTVARDYFTRAYVFNPNYPTLHVNLGIVTDAMGDTAAAEGWFLRALHLDPNYQAGHSFYARWLARHGRPKEAISHLERAVVLSPGDLEARHALLELYAATGDNAKLASLVRDILALAPGDSVARAYATRIPPQVNDTR
ncbi:MAG TPA: tetratricopeptide repeat protein [Gemmatimonadaceae bacterium]|nr:tetratricopeptide repeat protein [Gemmatimonadaceae bacterium]